MNRSLRHASRLAVLAFAAAACGFSPPTPVGPIAGVGSLEESVAASSLSVQQGGSASLSVTVTPIDGFTGPAQFAFVGAPAGITIAPALITLSGTAAQTATISVLASATTAVGTYQATLAIAGQISSAEVSIALTVTAGQITPAMGTLAVGINSTGSLGLVPNVAVLDSTGATVATITTLGSTSEQLAPGTYTVVASDVMADSATYTATVTGSPATVVADTTQTVTVTYNQE
jgi:hypothetical protein